MDVLEGMAENGWIVDVDFDIVNYDQTTAGVKQLCILQMLPLKRMVKRRSLR